MPVLLDFESRSDADLKTVGGRLYWEHQSTEAICCVLYDTGTGESEAWVSGDPTPALVRPDAVYAAHNMMGFDRFALSRLGWRSWDDPTLVDTSELARRAGLPGALDALGTRWLGLSKDKQASRFTRSLSRRSKARGREGQRPELNADALTRVLEYCASDVEILVHGWLKLEPFQEFEPEVQAADRRVNDRGIAFDSQLALRLYEEDERNAAIEIERVAKVIWQSPETVRAIANSPKQFGEATKLPDATKETVSRVLKDPAESEFVRALCSARVALASIARGKLEAGLTRVSSDGRLRDMHRYIGAHTWRWSGRGMQLQNIPRPDKRFESWGDDEICKLADRVLAGGHADAAEIDLLLRATLYAPPGRALVAEDFSGVEARALAFLAGDDQAVAVHTSGHDPYKVAASAIFGVPFEAVTKEQRQSGKVSELACGYQGGPGAIARFAESLGVDLAASGVSAEAIVLGWRKLHAPIVRFWYAVENAFLAAAQGSEIEFAGFTFAPGTEREVVVWMPSGRPLVYNEVRITRDERGRPRPCFKGVRGPEYTYGGKLTENLIQGYCRDKMAHALAECDRRGLCPVLHVHDEIVCEVDARAVREAAAELHEIMTTEPEWAQGFPSGAAGHFGKRYRK